MTQLMNEEVDVSAFYFAGKDMKTFPRKMSLGDRAVTFADGFRMSLRSGERLTYLFNMNAEGDGATYRLRQDGARWTLVGTQS